MRALARRAAVSVVCGILQCCVSGAAQHVAGSDDAARALAAGAQKALRDVASSHDDGNAEDGRLERLRTLEKVLSMEVRAVDAMSRIKHGRQDEWDRGFLSNVKKMGMKFMVQLDEEDKEDSRFDGMRCSKTASIHRAAQSDKDRGQLCSFVVEKCEPRTGFVNYLSVPYCITPRAPWLGSLIILSFLGVLFVWLIAMVDFLIPSLATLSKLCCLRQSVAGVTFLAFGNGCSDIFSMTAATLTGVKGMELAIGEVLGNGMLIFCFIQGIIAIITPFKANASEYLRDCGFYGMSLLLTTFVLFDGHMSMVEGAMFLGLYVVYVIVVVNFERVLQVMNMDPLMEEELVRLSSSTATEREQLMDEPGTKDGWMPVMNELYSHVSPVTIKRWREMEWYECVMVVIQAPVIILLRLSVPVVSEELPNDGWSRPVASMQMLLLPMVVAAFLSTHVLFGEGDNIVAWAAVLIGVGLVVGISLAVLMWINTENETPPSWHKNMSFVGFAAAVLYIYMTAAEIVNVILAFGVVFELGNFSLGVSILAIGIGMQDLVSNIGVARAGFPNMAASACVGAPLLNILLGLGVCAIAGNAVVANPYPLALTTQLVVCLLFLGSSVVFAVVFMVYSDYRAGTTLGIVLVSLYLVFLVVTLALDEYGGDSYNPKDPRVKYEKGSEFTFGETIGEGVR